MIAILEEEISKFLLKKTIKTECKEMNKTLQGIKVRKNQ